MRLIFSRIHTLYLFLFLVWKNNINQIILTNLTSGSDPVPNRNSWTKLWVVNNRIHLYIYPFSRVYLNWGRGTSNIFSLNSNIVRNCKYSHWAIGCWTYRSFCELFSTTWHVSLSSLFIVHHCSSLKANANMFSCSPQIFHTLRVNLYGFTNTPTPYIHNTRTMHHFPLLVSVRSWKPSQFGDNFVSSFTMDHFNTSRPIQKRSTFCIHYLKAYVYT